MAVMLKAGKYNKVITIEARNYPRERETNLHGEHKAFCKRLFDIYSVIDSMESHRELQLMCKEGEAYGEY